MSFFSFVLTRFIWLNDLMYLFIGEPSKILQTTHDDNAENKSWIWIFEWVKVNNF